MTIAGNFSAVIKIIKHSELQSELVLVRSNIGSVQRERWIAIAHFEVSQDLIVGTIFLDHVDDMLDGIAPAGKTNRLRIIVQQIFLLNLASQRFEITKRGIDVQTRDRAPQESGYIGMLVMASFP